MDDFYSISPHHPLRGRLMRRGLTAVAVLGLAGCSNFPALQADLQGWGLGGAVAPAANAPSTGAVAPTGSVVDPYAGQGVRTPTVEPPKSTTSTTPATTTPSAGATSAATAAQSHVVVSGETGWSIARKYGISIDDLARANNLTGDMVIRTGQTLTIPGKSGSTTTAPTSRPGEGSVAPAPPSAAAPLPAEQTQPANAPVAKPDVPDLGATRSAASGSGKFSMPVAGSILRSYQKGSNDGIDISAPAGTAVKAAGAGTVAAITKDSQGKSIVVIRHDNDLLTVYAGVTNVLVAQGASVAQGAQIASSDASGSIHFEVRRGFESVDPELYLI